MTLLSPRWCWLGLALSTAYAVVFLRPCAAALGSSPGTQYLARGQTLFQPPQAGVCEDGQARSGNCARQNHLIIDHGQAAKNIFAEATGADGGSDGGDPDREYGGNADARDDHAQRQREFHLPEQLAVRHAHAAS